jgi:uncharacterized membrane protein
VSDYLSVFLLAAMPISELRGAIPAALFSFQFSPVQAYLIAVIGNIIPVIILLWAMPRGFERMRERISFVRKYSDWYFAKLERRNNAAFKKWGAVVLLLFVAVPLPLTGAWSGALLAFLFKIPFWQAFTMIGGGVAIAGVIVLSGSLGLLHFL